MSVDECKILKISCSSFVMVLQSESSDGSHIYLSLFQFDCARISSAFHAQSGDPVLGECLYINIYPKVLLFFIILIGIGRGSTV